MYVRMYVCIKYTYVYDLLIHTYVCMYVCLLSSISLCVLLGLIGGGFCLLQQIDRALISLTNMVGLASRPIRLHLLHHLHLHHRHRHLLSKSWTLHQRKVKNMSVFFCRKRGCENMKAWERGREREREERGKEEGGRRKEERGERKERQTRSL